MSFSTQIKSELAFNRPVSARHCDIAEILAFLNNNAVIGENFSNLHILLKTDNNFLAFRFFDLIKKNFDAEYYICFRNSNNSQRKRYLIYLHNSFDVDKILNATGRIKDIQRVTELNRMVLKDECCKRSYLRACFISNGSMTDPEKSYHVEFVFTSLVNAEICLDLLSFFQLNPKLISRKKHLVVYIKEGENISDLLNVIGAHTSLLKFENTRVMKFVSNDVNRKVNCETANLSKTIVAAVSYEQDIRFIEKARGLSILSKPLLEVAECRLEYPNATLKEIGEMIEPPISKSGVNHRLRKISNIADKLRRD